MRLDDFRDLVEHLKRDIPTQFESGVAEIDVSPKTVPDPVHRDVYTLGECIPLTWTGDGTDLHSRIVLFTARSGRLPANAPISIGAPKHGTR